MNEEFQFKNWGYKDLGMLGAYIVEKNNESYKQIDVTNVKQYIKDLIEENQQLKEKLQQKEDIINKAKKLLGNYRHYSMPDEKQNSDNEDLANNAFDILKEVE